jgi:hypothetical protein
MFIVFVGFGWLLPKNAIFNPRCNIGNHTSHDDK